MATIMSLFSRRNSAGDEAATEELYSAPIKLADQRSGAAIHSRDTGAFEMLGENQQSIDFALTGVYQGLMSLQSLVEQMADLKSDLNKSFEDHRKLALSYSSIRQDRDHAQTRLAEKTELYEAAHGELVGLRTEIEDVRRSYERARTDFEALEHRHHLLSVA
jgi:chromosome segregation ATPase